MIAVLGSLLFLKYETLTPYRLSAEQIPIVEQLQRNPREVSCGKVEDGVSAGCTYGKGPIKALVIGDSHANAQMVSIGDRAALNNGSILALGFDLCLSVKDSYRVDDNGKNPKYDCGKLVANTIEMAAEKYPEVPVIIINRVSLYLFGNNEDKYIPPPAFFVDEVFSKRDESYFNNLTGHMVDTICEISKNNPVYLVRPIPELKKNVPMTMFNTLTVSGKVQPVKITRSDYDQRQILAFAMQDRAVAQCGAKILDPIPYLCDSDYCYGDSKDIPLYFDDNHLSGYGAKVISPIYNEVFKK